MSSLTMDKELVEQLRKFKLSREEKAGVELQDNEEKNRVAKGRLWSFEQQYLVLKEWSAEMNIKEVAFNTVDMWVQIWNIPNHRISRETRLKVGKLFQNVWDMVIPESGSRYGHVKRSCLSRKEDCRNNELQEGQFGDWL